VQNCNAFTAEPGVTNLKVKLTFLLLLIPIKETQSECHCNYTEVIVVEVVNGDKCHSFITFGSRL